MSIVSLFCEIHDFFLMYEAHLSTQGLPRKTPSERRRRQRRLHASEMMTLLIAFHQSNSRTLQHFYERHVWVYWFSEFPNLVSSPRSVELQQEVLMLLTFYLQTRLGTRSGISFGDATPLPVCDNRCISKHRVFMANAERGKPSMGGFYGFKRHLIINNVGELLSFVFTPANTDDRQPLLKLVASGVSGNLSADSGSISKDLRELLSQQGINLIDKVRKHMKRLSLSVADEGC